MALTTAVLGEWSGRRVLVTGAAGLLGMAVTDELIPLGATVIGFDIRWLSEPPPQRPGGIAVAGDVRDPGSVAAVLREQRPDTVVHLAAQTLVGPALADPVTTFRHNVEGTWVLMEACRNAPGIERIVVASSDKAYGDAGGRPYHERMALQPAHPYDSSKAMADLLARTYAHTYGLPVAVTRCANLYGGGDLNWSRIVPGTIRSVIEGERPVIRSDGTFVRDYLYAADAARGVLVLAEAAGRRADVHGQAYNFAAGVRLTAIEVAERILAVMGSTLQPRVLGTARNEVPVQRVSAARARRELGWRAETPLNQGLATTVDWYRAFLAGRST